MAVQIKNIRELASLFKLNINTVILPRVKYLESLKIIKTINSWPKVTYNYFFLAAQIITIMTNLIRISSSDSCPEADIQSVLRKKCSEDM